MHTLKTCGDKKISPYMNTNINYIHGQIYIYPCYIMYAKEKF